MARELLARLLATLEAQTCPAAELLVVDNGSTDGAPEMARARGARVIAMGSNAGFAAAVNRGYREAGPSAGRDSQLRRRTGSRLPGEAGGGQRAFRHRQDPQSGRPARWDLRPDLPRRHDVALRRRAAGCRRHSTRPRNIASPPWTAVLYRAEVFRQVGLLEESFESYLEDADFGLRCAAQGITGRYVPEARAVHRGERRAGAMASGNGAPYCAQSALSGGAAIILRATCVAGPGGTVPLGRRGDSSWTRTGVGARQVAGPSRHFSAAACRKLAKRIRSCSSKLLRSNEQIIQRLTVRIHIGSCISCSPVGQSDT